MASNPAQKLVTLTLLKHSCNKPLDFVNQKLIFIDESITFLFLTYENWLDNDFRTDQSDICAYTDGSPLWSVYDPIPVVPCLIRH